MIIYGDTSALAKLYIEEEGSAYVQDVLLSAERLLTSSLTRLELVSAIEGAKRIRRINSPTYRVQFSTLESDIRKGTLSFVEIGASVLNRAVSLIRIRRLRPPDAIQLATALEVNRRLGRELFFLCADRALLAAARSEGLRCKDVSSSQHF